MGHKIIWSPAAREDLKNLVSFIGQNNPIKAEEFGLSVLEQVEQASIFPESGRIVPEFEIDTLRELILAPYRIVYRINHKAKVIDVSRVWHSKRGKPRLER